MSRNAALAQSQRNFANPLVLGTFSTTSLRYLRGTLKAERKVVGYRDTSSSSNGGYGGGTFNHWFQINLEKPGWVIVTKGPPRPKYINVSTYDLNKNPILGLPIFDADSITSGLTNAGQVYIPYLDTVMQSQSTLYNNFAAWRIDRGDDRYFPLPAGSYLLCVSSTRNEPLDYEVGVVIEFPPTELFFALEDEQEVSLLVLENQIDLGTTILITSPITVDTIISNIPGKPNGFTPDEAQINSGVTVTILEGSEWLIGPGSYLPETVSGPEDLVVLETGDGSFFDTIHDHSLAEWREAWESQHQDTDRFPDIFAPLTNRP